MIPVTFIRNSCAVILLLFTCTQAFAQTTQNLDIAKPDTLIKNSLYNKINLIDARVDTTGFGTVQLGFFNRNAKLVVSKPLRDQLSAYVTGITDQSAAGGQLLVRVTQYEAYEVTKGMSEKGYCALHATLFAQNGNRFQKIKSIDTLTMLKSGIDVTKALLKNTGSALTGFIRDNLLHKPLDSTGYTYDELLRWDETAKQKITVFNTDKFVDGVYSTYQSFAAQTPDKPIKVDGYAVYPGVVKEVEADGKVTKVKGQNIYAIVFLGTAYIATKTDFYPIKKVGNDLFFTGQVKSVATAGEQVAVGMMFGMLGSLMLANSESTYEMKLDYRSGQFIRLREVADPAMASSGQ